MNVRTKGPAVCAYLGYFEALANRSFELEQGFRSHWQASGTLAVNKLPVKGPKVWRLPLREECASYRATYRRSLHPR